MQHKLASECQYSLTFFVLLFMFVLGIIIAILTLFGQAPDAAIKAFTETANVSQYL